MLVKTQEERRVASEIGYLEQLAAGNDGVHRPAHRFGAVSINNKSLLRVFKIRWMGTVLDIPEHDHVNVVHHAESERILDFARRKPLYPPRSLPEVPRLSNS